MPQNAIETASVPSVPLVTPLWKTRPCNFYAVGKCRKGNRCSFAHGVQDLLPSPDFERTSVCPVSKKFGHCTKLDCRYAHDVSELRAAPGLLKSKMCSFFVLGECVVGKACRFAHSADELQVADSVLRRGAVLFADDVGTHRESQPAFASPSLVQLTFGVPRATSSVDLQPTFQLQQLQQPQHQHQHQQSLPLPPPPPTLPLQQQPFNEPLWPFCPTASPCEPKAEMNGANESDRVRLGNELDAWMSSSLMQTPQIPTSPQQAHSLAAPHELSLDLLSQLQQNLQALSEQVRVLQSQSGLFATPLQGQSLLQQHPSLRSFVPSIPQLIATHLSSLPCADHQSLHPEQLPAQSMHQMQHQSQPVTDTSFDMGANLAQNSALQAKSPSQLEPQPLKVESTSHEAARSRPLAETIKQLKIPEPTEWACADDTGAGDGAHGVKLSSCKESRSSANARATRENGSGPQADSSTAVSPKTASGSLPAGSASADSVLRIDTSTCDLWPRPQAQAVVGLRNIQSDDQKVSTRVVVESTADHLKVLVVSPPPIMLRPARGKETGSDSSAIRSRPPGLAVFVGDIEDFDLCFQGDELESPKLSSTSVVQVELRRRTGQHHWDKDDGVEHSPGCARVRKDATCAESPATPSKSTRWCRYGAALPCNAPAQACALCPRSDTGSRTRCAACKCGLKVIQQNTFLTLEEEKEETGSCRRSRSQ